VRFQISDIFLPSREELFIGPPSEAEIEGTIVDFSDSGSKPRAFAVIEVISRHTVVVPTEKVKIIAPAPFQNGE
jgi:hypothetical protein